MELYDRQRTGRRRFVGVGLGMLALALIAGRGGNALGLVPPPGAQVHGASTLAQTAQAATKTQQPHTSGTAEAPRQGAVIAFVELSPESGFDFVHTAGRTPDKHVPETMGSGAAWLDYDGDGAWDLYLVDSGWLSGAPAGSGGDAGTNRLYRAAPGGRYERAPQARLADRGYGMGVAAADYDNDGWVDVFVTNYEANALYRNNGDGSFTDITETFGVGDDRWSASAAWGDLDLDGFVDLYVTNYVAYDPDNPRICGRPDEGLRMYCPPQMFDGVADILYRNDGGIRLQDITQAAGVSNATDGKGLALAIADIDEDGLPDIYVANDATRNFVYLNRGEMRFEDQGMFSGAGLSLSGQPQSGMGVDVGDLDGNGKAEIGVTNFYLQPVNLYKQVAPGLYLDETYTMGLGASTIPTLAFGLAFVDLDSDTDLDVVIANGHILDTHDFYAQPNQVFLNRAAQARAGEPIGAKIFREITEDTGPELSMPRVSRGLAYGDLNADGLPDLLVTNSDTPAQLLRNVTASVNHRLVLRLRGRAANRDALGAVVTLTSTDPEGTPLRQRYEVKSASSYLSQNATDLYVGLGSSTQADLEIRWPGGQTETIHRVVAGQQVVVRQGDGIVASRRLEGQ